MRKILFIIIILLFSFFELFGLTSPVKTVNAQACEDENGEGYTDPNNPDYYTPGCYSSSDCQTGACCYVTVPAAGYCVCKTVDCGAQTCDLCTQVCCLTGCKPIAEGCDGGGGGGCDATAPTNLSASRISPTKANITWTPGSNGTKQMLFVGAKLSEVKNNCPGTASPACVVIEKNLSKTLNQYITGDVLSAGTVYFIKVVNYKDSSCEEAKRISYLSSCLDTPNPLTVNVGSTVTLSTQIYTDLKTKIAKVDYSTRTGKQIFPVCVPTWTPWECESHFGCFYQGGLCIGRPYYQSYPDAVSLNPTSDTAIPYLTQVTGVRSYSDSQIKTTIDSSVFFSGQSEATCKDTVVVNVLPADPWWQVVDGDVQTNGDLRSEVPSDYYFGLPGLGGFPGVAKYGGSTSLTPANVSEKRWLANSRYSPPNGVQNYAYFRRLVPSDVTPTPIITGGAEIPIPTGGTLAYGYEWYEYDANAGGNGGFPLSIMSSALTDRKVVIFVTGADLNIEGSITYNSGESILVVLTDRNINIEGNNLMGFFLADGNISTGVSANSLHVKGSVAALGSLVLQRNLGGSLNPTQASEVFEYDPATAFLFPPKLSVEKTRWKEVAP